MCWNRPPPLFLYIVSEQSQSAKGSDVPVVKVEVSGGTEPDTNRRLAPAAAHVVEPVYERSQSCCVINVCEFVIKE